LSTRALTASLSVPVIRVRTWTISLWAIAVWAGAGGRPDRDGPRALGHPEGRPRRHDSQPPAAAEPAEGDLHAARAVHPIEWGGSLTAAQLAERAKHVNWVAYIASDQVRRVTTKEHPEVFPDVRQTLARDGFVVVARAGPLEVLERRSASS
jgi:hypothetical protein